MTAFVRTSFTNNYRNLDPAARQHLLDAFTGRTANADKSLARNVLGQPDFVIVGTTDDNTAALNAGASQSPMLNFATETDVTFDNNFDRDIDIIAYTQDETDRNFQWIRQTVRGGSVNPSLVGGVKNCGPEVGGQVTFATAAATAAHSYGGFSITGAATATGRYAALIPKFRRLITKAVNLVNVGTGDLTAVGTTANLNASTGSTGVIELGIRAGAQENVAPADTVKLDVAFDLLPVESCELAVATTPTPDQIIIGGVGQSSENVKWTVFVYVGAPYPSSLPAGD
jgi:hypothetical protein